MPKYARKYSQIIIEKDNINSNTQDIESGVSPDNKIVQCMSGGFQTVTSGDDGEQTLVNVATGFNTVANNGAKIEHAPADRKVVPDGYYLDSIKDIFRCHGLFPIEYVWLVVPGTDGIYGAWCRRLSDGDQSSHYRLLLPSDQTPEQMPEKTPDQIPSIRDVPI